MGRAPSVAVLGSLIIFGKCYITVTDSNIYIQYFDVQEWMVTDLPLDLGYAVYTPVLDTHITPAQQVSSADNLDTFYFSSKFMTVTKR
jgi:hypothetical protein